MTTIGRNAFWERDHIEEVVLPSEITELAYGLETAELPVSFRTVGINVFARCEDLMSVSIPKYAVFDEAAFSFCTSLSEVKIEEGFDGLSNYLFAVCTSLTEIELPESLTEIAPFAFYQSGLTEIVIPAGVGRSGCVRSECTSLRQVTLQKGLRYIEGYAFEYTALTEVVIPEGVYLIGTQAFFSIETLEHVVLGPNLGASGYGAFAMCTALKTVTILNPTGHITDTAFDGCEKIDTVYFYGDEAAWETFKNAHISMDSRENPENGYGNTYLYNAKSVYYYSEESNTDGAHWHFGEDGKPQLWWTRDQSGTS